MTTSGNHDTGDGHGEPIPERQPPDQSDQATKVDGVEQVLVLRAREALNFIRAVRWGEAISHYDVTDIDGVLGLDILIHIKCYTRK